VAAGCINASMSDTMETTMRGKPKRGYAGWVAVTAASAYWVLLLAVLPAVLAHAPTGCGPQLTTPRRRP
jgi:hypothetical protein